MFALLHPECNVDSNNKQNDTKYSETYEIKEFIPVCADHIGFVNDYPVKEA
jgi:hypothetical protein